MSKRHNRKPGRKVYYKYKIWKAGLTRNEAVAEYAARARVHSPENLAARAKREQRASEAIISTLKMNRGADNEPREQVLNKLDQFVKLDDMDRHMIVHNSLKTVRILFYNKEETRFWFVERNLLTGKLRRSIDYGSREQAFVYHEADHVLFV